MSNPTGPDGASVPAVYSTITPSLSAAFISADDAAVFAHEQIGAIRNGIVYGGFILGKDGHFFATLPHAGGHSSFDPAQVLSLSDNGEFLPVAGYSIEAIYHSNTSLYRVPWAVHQESDLQDNFFSIFDLNLAITYKHNYPRFYLSCPDKCLLSYVASGSDLERAIQPLLSRTHPHYPGILERAYDTGSLMPSHLIGLVVLMGQLSVVLPGGHWARRSHMGVNWQQDQRNPQLPIDRQPVYGAVFGQLLDAVRLVQQQMLIHRTVQYAGFVLAHSSKSEFICTRPLAINFVEFNQSSIFPVGADGQAILAQGYKIVGVYLSGDQPDSDLPDAINEVFGDFFSPKNLLACLRLARSIPLFQVFFCTRRGGLLRYQSQSSDLEIQMLAQLTATSGTGSELETRLMSAQLSAQDYVRQVAGAGLLDVIAADEIWTHEGAVTDTWIAYEPVVTEDEGGQAAQGTS